MNDKVKVKYKKTGVTKEVKKSLASDYIATGEFELVEEKNQNNKFDFNKLDNSQNRENK